MLRHSFRCLPRMTIAVRDYPPRICRFSTHNLTPPGNALEEQSLALFREKRYYPIRIGEVFNNRYRIICKLGYGAYSTVWLAKDEKSNTYTSLKICVHDDADTSPILNEVKMLRHLREHASRDHPGIDFTRLATDILEVESHFGRDFCIAAKPEGASLRDMQERVKDSKVPKILVKSSVHHLPFSLNWLHFRCKVIHTDISPQNVLTESFDDPFCAEIEQEEMEKPSIPAMTDHGPVYRSREVPIQLAGTPILTDFGQMRMAEAVNDDWWMPDIYRAPEVLLGLPWSYPADIWSLGVMMLELMEGKNVFDPIDREHNQYVLPLALAQYIGYLGPPPLSLIKQSPLCSAYFDKDGNWRGEVPIPKTSLEDFVTTIPPGDEKTLFLKLVRKILTWDQEARQVANELIDDEAMPRNPINPVAPRPSKQYLCRELTYFETFASQVRFSAPY